MGGGQPRYSSNTFEVKDTKPATLEGNLECLHNVSKHTPNMRATFTAAGRPAEVLLDTVMAGETTLYRCARLGRLGWGLVGRRRFG